MTVSASGGYRGDEQHGVARAMELRAVAPRDSNKTRMRVGENSEKTRKRLTYFATITFIYTRANLRLHLFVIVAIVKCMAEGRSRGHVAR